MKFMPTQTIDLTDHRSVDIKSVKCVECGFTTLTHGEARRGKTSVEYRAFHCAKTRCTNPNTIGAKHYIERGIEFRYSSFEEFLADVGRRPTSQHSLDRKDNNGHYEPGNCRWATPEMQAINRENTNYITLNGVTKTRKEWAKETGISYWTIRRRQDEGQPPESILEKRNRNFRRH